MQDIQETKQQKIDYLNSLLPQDNDGYFLDVNGNKVSYGNDNSLSYIRTKLPLKALHIEEIKKCAQDVVYFVENYVRIRSLDEGLIFPELREYQIEMLRSFQQNRFNVVLAGRQSGKSITTILYVLWKCCFIPDTIVGLCAHQFSMAFENLQRFRDMYSDLPIWLKPSVSVFNRESFANELGCKVYISATTDSAFRGKSVGLIMIDECFTEDTRVLIRDKETMVEKEVTIKQLYDLIQ